MPDITPPGIDSRLGLNLLSDDADLSPQRDNFQKLITAVGVRWVADGTIPPPAELYEGAVIGEITSGKIWVAKSDGVGGFTRRWLHYPWHYVASTPDGAYGINGTAYNNWGFSAFSRGVNSSAADKAASNFVKLPIKGIYDIHINYRWAQSGTGFRAAYMIKNGSNAELGNTEVIVPAISTAPTNVHVHVNDTFEADDVIGGQVWQNSGGTLNVYASVFITLLKPFLTLTTP